MKLSRKLSVAAFVLVAPCIANVATADKKADDGFVALYNGKDLTNFETEGNWIPEDDGVLSLQPRPGEKGWTRYGSYLWADKQYGDFIFDVEYKHPKGGNSGVFVRVKDPKNPVNTGIEVQILDSHGKKGKLGHHDCGGVIRTTGPSKNMAKPAGEWNRMIVTCKGSHMKVELNGEQIIDLDLADSAVKDRPLKGYVGLQDHGQLIWFRNIRIKPLD